LGEEVAQRGSNITAERLRFDFNFSRKVNKEELNEIERLVNEYIEQDVEVIWEEMPIGRRLRNPVPSVCLNPNTAIW
jgi:alanyl-tRNA synthetase